MAVFRIYLNSNLIGPSCVWLPMQDTVTGPWPLTPGRARLGPFILALTGRHGGGDLGLDLCQALAMVVHGARCLKGT